VSEFYQGLAEILEVEESEVRSDMELGESWDSLAVVSTIALIDDVHDVTVHPNALVDCKTVGDIEKLIEEERAGASKG